MLNIHAPSAAPRTGATVLLGFAMLALASLVVLALLLIDRYIYKTLISPNPQGNALRLLTWNIGKIYLSWDSRAADRDFDYVATTIREVDADIVALQEIRDRTQLGALLAALGPDWRGRVPEDAYDRRAALLSRLPVTFFDLPTSTGRTAQAALVGADLPEPLAVVSLHLDAFDAERRRRQAEEIFFGAWQLGTDQIVLAGDFNFDPRSITADSADHLLYRFLSHHLVDAGKAQGGTTVISQRLDYIFYRSTVYSRVTSEVLRDRRINIMDHDPLLVEFR